MDRGPHHHDADVIGVGIRNVVKFGFENVYKKDRGRGFGEE